MKYFLFFIAFLFSIHSVYAEELVFAHGFEDLPIMPELKQIDDGQLKFDTPSGRIIEAVFTGEQTQRMAIKEFYTKTLPQLGWKVKEQGIQSFSFSRDEEELRFIIENSDPILVKIELMTVSK
ncbi:MAG: hypothetical protein MJ250_04155 [Alphaproteobacteria bacterium]|nr:hypothetical protein [Alphaproteobacteria bacterium]